MWESLPTSGVSKHHSFGGLLAFTCESTASKFLLKTITIRDFHSDWDNTYPSRGKGVPFKLHAVRRFCSRFTREVTNGKLLEVYSVSADALGEYCLWLAPRNPSKLTGADPGLTAWPDDNSEGRRKGGAPPLFSRGQANPMCNFKAGGISFASFPSAAFPHTPGLLSLGPGAP